MENFDAEQPMEDLQEQTPKKEPKNPLYDCYSLLHDLVYILAAITIVFVFFVRLVGVDGPSMMPTLQDGDYVALLSNLFMGDLEQGDVIVARKESFENGEPIVKRVIATEGQTVDILYDGNGYLKVYEEQVPDEAEKESFLDCDGVLHMQPVLVSYNEKYAPRVVSPELNFQIAGRVLN